jgi:hypothetical protein
MAKKEWTPEQRAAFGAKMKASREAKQNLQNKKPQVPASEPEMEYHQNDDVEALKKRVDELTGMLGLLVGQNQAPSTVVANAKQVLTKYSFDPKDYPDPRPKIFQYFTSAPRLQRLAFQFNYDLDWEVQKVNFEEDGQKYQAPRFVLKLLGKVIDEDTQDIKKYYDPKEKKWFEQRYIVRQGMFFEDPDSYVFVANLHGVEVPEDLIKEFCDEMRYLTMRDWVQEYFFPPQAQTRRNEKETVIGNQLVKVYEVNTDDPRGYEMDELLPRDI